MTTHAATHELKRLGQDIRDGAFSNRRTEEIALSFIAAFGTSQLQLVLSFNALHYGPNSQATGELGSRMHDRFTLFVVGHVSNKGTIDL